MIFTAGLHTGFRSAISRPAAPSGGAICLDRPVFTCLSHDVIAHETTHAIVDGIREYFMEPTNIDVPAFHEAFADLAALFAHFTHEEVLLDTLRKTGGRLFNRQLNVDVIRKAPRQKFWPN